jgi:DNA mismatch endonuclease Vsr
MKSRRPKAHLAPPDFTEVPAARRRNLAAVRGRDTQPELILRQALHRLGYRFRLHVPSLPGRPDIVFPGRRAVIEVRGCFWHRHGCSRSVMPRTRAEWWERKLARNVERDTENALALDANGWRLAVVWECEIRTGLPRVISSLCTFLGRARTRASG